MNVVWEQLSNIVGHLDIDDRVEGGSDPGSVHDGGAGVHGHGVPVGLVPVGSCLTCMSLWADEVVDVRAARTGEIIICGATILGLVARF